MVRFNVGNESETPSHGTNPFNTNFDKKLFAYEGTLKDAEEIFWLVKRMNIELLN